MIQIRRAFADAFVSIAALTVLLAVLVSVDDRVREQVSLRLTSGHAQTELADAGMQVRDLATVIVEAARSQSVEHAPMMLFVLSASVLTLFMLRT